jgi:uncharacterized protein
MGTAGREDHLIPVEDAELAAWLYRPDTATAGDRPAPCVVMTNGFSATRHEGLADYAEVFRDAGLAVLAMDFRNLGDSTGQPRQHVPLRQMVRDRAAAVDWVRRQRGVDPDRIVLWGFSMGGGTAVVSAGRLPGIAALLLVAPFLDGPGRVRSGKLNLKALRPILLDSVGVRRALQVTGPPGSVAVMDFPGEQEGWRRAVRPGSPWRNEVTGRSMLTVTTWRPVRHARKLVMPVWLGRFDDDISVSAAAIDRLARRAPDVTVRNYPGDHFAPIEPGVASRIAADQVDFLRTHGLL